MVRLATPQALTVPATRAPACRARRVPMRRQMALPPARLRPPAPTSTPPAPPTSRRALQVRITFRILKYIICSIACLCACLARMYNTRPERPWYSPWSIALHNPRYDPVLLSAQARTAPQPGRPHRNSACPAPQGLSPPATAQPAARPARLVRSPIPYIYLGLVTPRSRQCGCE